MYFRYRRNNTPALGCAIFSSLFSLCTAAVLAGGIKTFSLAEKEGGVEPLRAISIEKNDLEKLVAQGRTLYGLGCSHCHGGDARGDEGPDLHALALSDTRIAATIRKGIKGEMPAFEKKYSPQEISALVSYLRSLH